MTLLHAMTLQWLRNTWGVCISTRNRGYLVRAWEDCA